ncbi:MAG: GIY-YIG nuclease family protein [Candidatus Micrarchaeota archaeon]|nr:GIY-YIG nuclease family protein [Candidatus Micrarchaeota archaeon]
MTKSESLIDGHAERIESGILQTDGADTAFYNMIERKPGVYVLYRGSKIYYIGKSITSAGRIDGHFRDRLKGKWNNFAFYQVRHPKYLADLETLLIHATRSKQGKRRGYKKGHFRTNNDLTREFLVRFKEAKQLKESELYELRESLVYRINELRNKYNPKRDDLWDMYRKRINKFKKRRSEKAKMRISKLRDERNKRMERIENEWWRKEEPLKNEKDKVESKLATLRKNARRVKRLTRW